MSQTKEQMTIGQLAKRVDKTPRALRLYEEMGLIVPAGRSEGGFRLYGEDALARLQWILELVELGLPLAEIQNMLEAIGHAPHGGAAMDVLRDEFVRRLDELDAQIARLIGLRQAVSAGLRYLDRCENCTRKPLPECCTNCIAEVGPDLPDMVAGLLAQSPVDRTDPCQKLSDSPKPME
ncbi:MAG: MerR family transcriptional regulator [Myxococcales bacterium]|nr:MerR family transcriptional regulator [Myxococcales bacterium]